MIRINLLPTKAKEKARTVKNEGIIALVVIVAMSVFCYAVDKKKQQEINEANDKIKQLQVRINQYKEDIKRVEDFKRKKADLNAKLNAIKDLDKRRSGPVKMMDEFATIMPKKLWITNFKENNKKLTLEGVAVEGPVVSDFLERLRNSRFFQGPQLIQTQQVAIDGKAMQKFNIVCRVKYSA